MSKPSPASRTPPLEGDPAVIKEEESLAARGPGTCSLCGAWARPHGALTLRVIDGAFLSPQGRQQWVHRDGWAGAVQTVGAHSTPVFPGNLFPVSLVLLGHKTSSLRTGKYCPGKASPRDDFAHLQSSLSHWGALATTRAAVPGTRLGPWCWDCSGRAETEASRSHSQNLVQNKSTPTPHATSGLSPGVSA